MGPTDRLPDLITKLVPAKSVRRLNICGHFVWRLRPPANPLTTMTPQVSPASQAVGLARFQHDRAAPETAALWREIQRQEFQLRINLAQQPCLVCGRVPCHAHHLGFTQSRALGKRSVMSSLSHCVAVTIGRSTAVVMKRGGGAAQPSIPLQSPIGFGSRRVRSWRPRTAQISDQDEPICCSRRQRNLFGEVAPEHRSSRAL